jgi:hypothetical protein
MLFSKYEQNGQVRKDNFKMDNINTNPLISSHYSIAIAAISILTYILSLNTSGTLDCRSCCISYSFLFICA